MNQLRKTGWLLPGFAAIALLIVVWRGVPAQPPPAQPSTNAKSSYDQIAPVLMGKGTFKEVMAKDKADKAAVMDRQKKLLEERYDLTARPDSDAKMTRGKVVQVGPTARLADGMSWDKLAAMSPADIREKGLFPKGYLPLPHPKHEAGGMLFPQMEIKQLARLERFDLDFDLPEHFLPEFPPPIFLITRKDLGDVSQGKLVTVENFQEIFAGILNAKDLEGMRLLVTQFPQQQFNATADRKTERPDGMQGDLLRLPRQRPYLRGDPPGGRHPSAGPSPAHRHSKFARGQHPAAIRLTAGPQDNRGLH
jgi:cytochrome c peroxidase